MTRFRFLTSFKRTLLIVLVLYIASSALAYGYSLWSVSKVPSQLRAAQILSEGENPDEAFIEYLRIGAKVRRANYFRKFGFWVGYIPGIKKYTLLYTEILDSASIFSGVITEIVQQLTETRLSLKFTLDNIDFEQLPSVYLDYHEEVLVGIEKLKIAIALSKQLDASSLPSQVQSQFINLQEELAKAENVLTKVEPFFDYLPTLFGQDDQQKILFLLQNIHELRPTGGFIGTIGRLNVTDGVIGRFETEDVYSYDGLILGREQELAPEPLQRYADLQYWYLRDANWSPDFPTSAQKVIDFYEYATNEEGIDTVVAITPFLVQKFLEITGPITVDGIEFTAENLVDALQYRVEQEFWQQGIPLDRRKEIINDLMVALQDRVFTLSFDELLEWVDSTFIALENKEILLYAREPKLQETIFASGWAGQVYDIGSDYLYVVDANLGALKTDRVMTRNREYSIRPTQDGRWIANLKLTYTNNGEFDYRTTRYRTYTRVYVPIGSWLINAAGSEDGISTYAEFNKTVFAGFYVIEPGETKTITLEYYLPEWLTVQFKDRELYELYYQKQGGVPEQSFSTDLILDRKITGFTPSAIEYNLVQPNRLQFTEEITEDQFYQLNLE